MIDPGSAVDLASAMRQLYGDAEVRMLERVASRLERGIDTVGWTEAKAAEVTTLNRELASIVDRLETEGADLLPSLLEQAQEAGHAAAAGVAGDTFALVGSQLGAVQALATSFITGLQGTHFAILRQSEDLFRSTIAAAAGAGTTGTITRREAAQQALRSFADSGISGFVDTSGRHWDLGSYVEMSTRTAIGQAYLEAHVAALQARGRDLVIVSDSPDECPLCRRWEGKVLSLSGADPQRPSLAAARAGGLFHPSCTHSLGLYVDGLTRPMRRTSDAKGNAERARQRELERNLRRWRRREATAITSGARQQATAKVAEWRAGLSKFSADTGRRRDYGREALSFSSPPHLPLRHASNEDGVSWAKRIWGSGSLTPAQRKALERYTEGGYATINGFLRGADLTDLVEYPEDLPAELAAVKTWIKSLDRVVARTVVPDDVVVWRALGADWQGLRDLPSADVALRQLAGQVLSEPGYLSTSVGAAPALSREIVMRLTVPAGTPGYYAGLVSVFPQERELILGRGRRYVITSVQEQGGRWLVDATVLP